MSAAGPLRASLARLTTARGFFGPGYGRLSLAMRLVGISPNTTPRSGWPTSMATDEPMSAVVVRPDYIAHVPEAFSLVIPGPCVYPNSPTPLAGIHSRPL